MRDARDIRRYCLGVAAGLAFGLPSALGCLPALAQSLDLGGSAETSAHAPSLDMDVNPGAPLSVPPAAPHDDTLRAGLLPLTRSLPGGQQGSETVPASPPPADAQPPNTATAAPTPPAAEPIVLDKPRVIDTAKLTADDVTVALFGIVGLTGDAAQELQKYIAAAGAKVTCQQQPNAEYVCLLADGTDLAEVSLVNGAAQTRGDASDAYRAQEVDAQNARRGVWADLPPPPVQLAHPTLRDTATLVVDGRTYRLDGIDGLGGQFSRDLRGYIAAHDDTLMCQPQAKPDHYICVLADGTDIAKVALVNGAAKVALDAPESYRLQQGEALNNKRGIWANVTIAATYTATVTTPPPPAYAVAPGDEADGVSYVGGVPSAVIAGQMVFLSYGGGLGWGYYDHWHHWHGAPPGFAAHMEHFHPGGSGLRGYHEVGGHPAGFGGPHLAAAGMGQMGHFGGGFVHPNAFGGGFHGAPAGGGFHVSGGGGAPHHR